MAITAGSALNTVPAPVQQALASNYLDLSTSAGWGQQYVPDLMEKEVEVFGPRTISGFLSQVGAEESMTADQVIWSEQGRLHLSYTGNVSHTSDGTGAGAAGTTSGYDTITITKDIDGNDVTAGTHGVRVNDTIIVSNSDGIFKCLVTAVIEASNVISVTPYGTATLTANTTADATTILVYGSEYGKGASYMNALATGTTDQRGGNEPSFKTFSNKPIILKDYYEVSGSDASRVGWVEVAAEDGTSGYLWYLKAASDTRARFNDYLEMAMLEGEKGGGATDQTDSAAALGAGGVGTALGENNFETGTEGLFAAIEARGNLTSGVTGVNAATDLAEFDAILAEFDKQGAIEENMMFVNRATSLAMDDMLASMNSYGAGGTSYGVFDNSEDMALNLGFSGFRRGSYDFYKSDFRYLNDLATRGGINAASSANAIRGVIIPAGTSTVYDQMLGKNLRRPFLHVRYRASQTDDRRLKTWTTGSVGAATSALDAMQIHMLSERCLITQGANNFMLMK
tara:strand:+ start:568 stop:2103 length:1536 start_codon:yes stop_codon:yes gene_type:complete